MVNRNNIINFMGQMHNDSFEEKYGLRIENSEAGPRRGFMGYTSVRKIISKASNVVQ